MPLPELSMYISDEEVEIISSILKHVKTPYIIRRRGDIVIYAKEQLGLREEEAIKKVLKEKLESPFPGVFYHVGESYITIHLDYGLLTLLIVIPTGEEQ